MFPYFTISWISYCKYLWVVIKLMDFVIYNFEAIIFPSQTQTETLGWNNTASDALLSWIFNFLDYIQPCFCSHIKLSYTAFY